MNLWFTEDISIVPGSRVSLKISKILHSEKSDFQQIEVYETSNYGRMLVLDDVIMTTEFDEFSYHEMISHVPLFAHPDPKRVLVIGGGDGGTVREVLRHPGVEEVVMCEIDRRVAEVCEDHMPSLAGRLREKRVALEFRDGVEWVRNHPDTYDVIMVDSTDPVGLAENLFKYPFLEDCKKALKADGIMTNQAENFLLHTKIIRDFLDQGRKLFPVARYYHTNVPTYPGGLIGFTFFSKKADPFAHVKEKLTRPGYPEMVKSLRYWSPEAHEAAFVLPAETRRKLFD